MKEILKTTLLIMWIGYMFGVTVSYIITSADSLTDIIIQVVLFFVAGFIIPATVMSMQ